MKKQLFTFALQLLGSRVGGGERESGAGKGGGEEIGGEGWVGRGGRVVGGRIRDAFVRARLSRTDASDFKAR